MKGHPCGRQFHEELANACLFHREGPKDPAEFRREFETLLPAEGGGGQLDCTGFVFPDFTLHKVEVHGVAWFDACRFTGKAIFQEVTFHQGADFYNSRFEGDASFHKSLFRDQATFQRTTFRSVADFAGCQFEGNCDFGQARFLELTSFASARFVQTGGPTGEGYFVFMDAQFHARTEFSLATFEGNTTFRGARFLDIGQFSHISLQRPKAKLSLMGASAGFEAALDFSDVRVDRTDGVRFSGPAAPFPQSNNKESLDLSGVRFRGADVARMQFADVRWGPAPGRRANARHRDMGAVFDDMETGGPRHWLDWEGDRAMGERLVLIYKGLRESYERHFLFAEAGRFHVREMECRRRGHGSWAQRQESAPSSHAKRLWKAVAAMRRQANLLNAYRFTSNYGESYVRAFWSIAAWFILVAAFERWLRPLWFPRTLGWPHELANQAITLMPAQVAGDSVTDFIGRLVGVFLITGFVIALRRHFRR